MINMAIPCFAFEFNQVNLYKKGDCGSLLKYFGNPLTISYVVYNYNGKEYPAYCLNSNLAGAESGGYSVETLNKLDDNLTWKVIINGFPYKTPQELGVNNEYEAFAATKQAVYWAWEERPEDKYSAVDSDAGRRTYNAFKKIINAAKNETRNEATNIVLNVLPVTNIWDIDENESDRVSKIYKVNSSINTGTYSINLSGELPSGIEITDLGNNVKDIFSIGEQFKITIPIQNLDKDGDFVITANADLKTYPVLYGKTYAADKQDYAITGLVYEAQDTVYGDNYNINTTKINLYKKEQETGIPMQNVEFQLQDENHKVLVNSVKTDGNGKIVFDNLVPGKYYLRELSTLEGYTLYNDLIEVDVHLFEEANVTVNNNKIKEKEVVVNTQNIEVTSNSESTLVTVNDANIVVNKEENRLENNVNIKEEVDSKIDNKLDNEVDIENSINNDIDNKIENKEDIINSIDNRVKNGLENQNDIENKLVNKINNETKNVNRIDNNVSNLINNRVNCNTNVKSCKSNEINNNMIPANTIINRTSNRVLPRTGY